jgi:hypothetical protein
VVSATQTTRSGFTNSDPGLEDTSESFGLPATADFMFALISTEELEQLIEPKGFELGTDSWLELARDGEGRKRLLEVNNGWRQMISRQLELGKAEGWIRKSIDSEGTATILLALFSGLQLEREVGLAVDTKATACAIADLFGGLLVSRSSSTNSQP